MKAFCFFDGIIRANGTYTLILRLIFEGMCNMKMKKILVIILFCIVLSAAACSLPTPSVNAVISTAGGEDFELTLHINKDSFAEDELIECYAVLEYIGKEDSITVYSGDPLVGFGLADDTYFDGGYMTNDVLMRTTFEKGKAVRYEYVKSGGWTNDDPLVDFYKEFYANKEFSLPAGMYEISANIDYSRDENDMLGTRQKLTARAVITVK